MICECFSTIPEFEYDDFTCIHCGKTFHQNNHNQFDDNILPPTNLKNKTSQTELINAYINNIEKNKNNFNNSIVNDIIYLFRLSTQTYKTINSYSKIKSVKVFCYLSCWYVLKNYNQFESLIELLKIKPKNINKFNKVFYVVCQSESFKNDYNKIHNIESYNILFDDYSWIVYDILKHENKLDKFNEISTITNEMFQQDKFISLTNFKKYILKIINNN